MAKSDKTVSDFVCMVFEDDPGTKHALLFANGYWALKRGTMKPYARATGAWPCPNCYKKQSYRILFFPRNAASHPAPRILEREILRNSALRAMDEGWVENYKAFADLPDDVTGAKTPRKDEDDE